MNKPYLGDGYARNVQVQSEKTANDLIRKRKIFLFSSSVDVRPYVNVYGKKKPNETTPTITAPISAAQRPQRRNFQGLLDVDENAAAIPASPVEQENKAQQREFVKKSIATIVAEASVLAAQAEVGEGVFPVVEPITNGIPSEVATAKTETEKDVVTEQVQE
jgi:hypothetical protein